MSRPWPLRLAAREGLATARTGRWTSVLVVLAVAWAVAAPGALDAKDVTNLLAEEQAWIDGGGHVLVVTGATQDGTAHPVPVAACERLDRVSGVQAAFALANSGAVGTLAQLPGGHATVYDVSPGVEAFLRLDATPGPSAIATGGFARRTGVRDREAVTMVQRDRPDATSSVAGRLTLRVADSSAMGEEFDGALLMPAALTGTATACYVRTDAVHASAVEAMLPAALADDGVPAVASPRLTKDQFSVDFTHAYTDRALRWAWVACAAVLALLWAMLQWFRRSQVAVYATFGMPAAARAVMQSTEWAALAGIGLLWGWALGVIGALALGARTAQAVGLVTSHAALTVLACGTFVVLLGLRPAGTLLTALKDR